MRIIDFIFYIIGRFNLLTKDQFTDLYNEIETDWAKVQPDPEKDGYTDNWKAKVKSAEKSPYRRLGLAIAAIPTVKIIQDWMLSKPEEEEEEEEEEREQPYRSSLSDLVKRK